jgi:predicted Zn-dependent peptidase
MSTDKIHTHTFSNGLRLVYEHHSAKMPQTHIRAFCHVGSINECDDIRGASHFIEHMCFKGCTNFPSWTAVNEPFSRSGAFFNATTTKQYTCFIVDCLDYYVHPFLKILGDMMLKSKFEKKEYKLELNVVREETKLNSIDSYIENMAFYGSAYENWVDHPSYHNPGCLPYNKVIDYYHKYYVPQNMVLSIVSSISFDTIIHYISSTSFTKHMSHIMPITNPNLGILLSSCESNYILKPSDSETSRVEIGVRVCNQFESNEFHALNILRHIISVTMSSRLFVELREIRGLTYRSGSYMTLYETVGVFVIFAISDCARLMKDKKRMGTIPVMFSILDDLVKNGVTDGEMKMAKQNIRESLKMDSVAGADKSSYNGIRVMLHNESEKDIMSNGEIYEKCYKKITKTTINQVIRKYFSGHNYYLSITGGKLPNISVLVPYINPK